MSIQVTGSEGLIGAALTMALSERGEHVSKLDLKLEEHSGDILDMELVNKAVSGCRGIIHLAAISRVVTGEQDPLICSLTNINGTRNVIRAALSSAWKPWLIYASSREVYGSVDSLPATEDTPLDPVNVYGRTKAAAEGMVSKARDFGLPTAIARFSNVYGSTRDHGDRVIPAFARAAVIGMDLRVDGYGNTFDFTHLDDTVRGLISLIDLMDVESPPPPIHFLTGYPCTLGEAARGMVAISDSKSNIIEAPSRSFDVSKFYGDPSRARSILGWIPQVSVSEGFSRMIDDFKAELFAPNALQEAL